MVIIDLRSSRLAEELTHRGLSKVSGSHNVQNIRKACTSSLDAVVNSARRTTIQQFGVFQVL